MPLYAVAEDLVEEDARRLPLEDRRAGERLGDRGRAQRQQVLHRLLRLRADRVVGREGVGGLGVNDTIDLEVHAVVGAGRGGEVDEDARRARLHDRPFGVHEVACLDERAQVRL